MIINNAKHRMRIRKPNGSIEWETRIFAVSRETTIRRPASKKFRKRGFLRILRFILWKDIHGSMKKRIKDNYLRIKVKGKRLKQNIYRREHRDTPKDYLSQRSQRTQRVFIHFLGERCGRGEKNYLSQRSLRTQRKNKAKNFFCFFFYLLANVAGVARKTRKK